MRPKHRKDSKTIKDTLGFTLIAKKFQREDTDVKIFCPLKNEKGRLCNSKYVLSGPGRYSLVKAHDCGAKMNFNFSLQAAESHEKMTWS